MMMRAPALHDHPAFAAVPARFVRLSHPEQALAVHLRGKASTGALPLVCLAPYYHNMTVFADFADGFARTMPDHPLVLLDLRGRGRSSKRNKPGSYTATRDAEDVSSVLTALGIERAIFLGMGHGGQVVMALGAYRPTLIAGAALIDAGPGVNPRGLVRARNNLRYLAGLRGAGSIGNGMRQMLAADYPGLAEPELDRLALRTHLVHRGRRAFPLFDFRLVDRLDAFDPADPIEPQWQYLATLSHLPLLLGHTERSDQLPTYMFEQMLGLRPDAEVLEIAGQGTPALLRGHAEIGALVGFVRAANGPALKIAAQPVLSEAKRIRLRAAG